MAQDKHCSICGEREFKEYNTRPEACCTHCGSLERTRLLWAVMESDLKLTPHTKVIHFAPELSLATRLYDLLGKNYTPCDIEPGRFKTYPAKVRRVDMCNLRKIRNDTYDLVIHNHVLEHICCNVPTTLLELRRILKPGGLQLFSVPFRGQETREYLGDDMSDEERTREFGQPDHIRLFGRADFLALLEETYGKGAVTHDMSQKFSAEDLDRISVPEKVLRDLSGETIFQYQKPIEQHA